MDLSLSTVLQSLAFVSGVTGQWLIARRSRHAFVAWTISNVVLIAFSAMSAAWWLLAMYSVYLAGSVFAWWQWRTPVEKVGVDGMNASMPAGYTAEEAARVNARAERFSKWLLMVVLPLTILACFVFCVWVSVTVGGNVVLTMFAGGILACFMCMMSVALALRPESSATNLSTWPRRFRDDKGQD